MQNTYRSLGRNSAVATGKPAWAWCYPRRLPLVAFCLAWLFLPVAAHAVSPPPGWRMPTGSDRTGAWEGSDAAFHIQGDFNGDGVADEAWILFRNSGKSWAVFVFLHAADGTARTMRLTEERNTPAQQFVLETIRPSSIAFRTACGKGYFECAKGEPLTIQFHLPSISVCLRESSCSVYVWQPRPGRFQQVRMRD